MDLNKYIGIEFEDLGRTEKGLDCWGLLCLIYEEHFNINLPPYVSDYSTSDKPKEVTLTIDKGRPDWSEVTIASGKPGDLLLFALASIPTHVGMYIGNNKFIHIIKGSNCTIEKINAPLWRRRFNGIFRHKERI